MHNALAIFLPVQHQTYTITVLTFMWKYKVLHWTNQYTCDRLQISLAGIHPGVVFFLWILWGPSGFQPKPLWSWQNQVW